MADDIVVESRDAFDAALAAMARPHRMVFFAGLPGVGKSLFIRELARAGHAMGRNVHLLQWDVARPADPSHPLLVRYPERDHIAHPMVRKVIGEWAREALVRWHQEHPSPAMLIGEVPFVGNRLVELAQVRADDAEPLLAGPQTLFATPVPSVPVRAAIEAARKRTFDHPSHAREAGDAPPGVMRRMWQDTHALAVEIGAAKPVAEPAPFDPEAYAAVYRHVLRHRRAITVRMNVELAQRTSVYDVGTGATDLVPTPAEIAVILARLEGRHTAKEVEDSVSRWFHSV